MLLTRAVVPCRFHVHNHSSAHIYLRLPKGETIDDVVEDIVHECAQLTKANSIEGGTSEVMLNVVSKRILEMPGA